MSKKIKTPPAATPPAPPRLDTLGRPISPIKRGADKKFRKPRGLLPSARTPLFIKGTKGTRQRDQSVRRMVQKMRANMDWIQKSDIPACRAWAELEVLGATAYVELKKNGMLTVNGEARKLVDTYRMLRQTQLAFERELGMTPAARMAIRVNSTGAALDAIGLMQADAIESNAATANGADGADNDK